MTIQQFEDFLHRAPFQPFTIHMADGKSFRVSHPDFVARSISGRTVIVFTEDDHFSALDLLLMSELEAHPADDRAA